MPDFVKNLPVIGAVAALTIGVVLFSLGGCNIGDHVQTDVPPQVRNTFSQTGRVVPPTVTFNQAVPLFEDYILEVKRINEDLQRGAERFAQNIEDDASFISWVGTFSQEAIGQVTPYLGGVPGGALLVGGLGMLSTLFLTPPGLKRKQEAELAAQKEQVANQTWEEAVASTLALVAAGKGISEIPTKREV